jgi:hypothetical protein
MRNLTAILFLLTVILSSCGGDENIPATPIPPVTPPAARKMYFHCDIHNLNYRFTQYTDDKYKALKMPCPVCKYDSAIAFMKKNELVDIQLMCPIDSTWTAFWINYTDVKFFLRDKKPFNPIIPLVEDFKGISLDDLTVDILNKKNKDYTHFPDCWCEACYSKVRLVAIKTKQDSITTFHNSVNAITGLTFTTYPINTGVPPDRRARAMQILDSIERIMPQLSSDYKKEYSSINCFVGYFKGNRQRYIYSQKTGTPLDSYVSQDVAFRKISADEYISDTVVINIGGGPDYRLDGAGVTIPLFKTKSTANTIQSVKSLQTSGHKSLSHAGKTRVNRSKVEAQYQLSTDFYPGNIDFLPSQYLPRKYNTYTTSEFIIFHPQKGNQLTYKNLPYTWNFIDLAKTVGGYDKQFPYNISSVYNAEVLNDVGTMEIRKVVEWCKARGKHMVLMGSSWGGAMIFNYLLYYPTTDFDKIIIADQNPNMQPAIVEKEIEDYIYGGEALKYGIDPTYKEINKNMCVISVDTYRRMSWLKNKDLSNTTFYYGIQDDNVGNIPTEDIATLKGQGATIYRFPAPIGHGVFHSSKAWYRYVTPTQM